MTVRDFQKCVEFNLLHGLRHAILGLGAPGVGKSQCIRQLGEKYGYRVIDLRLAQMSEVEIGGLIYPSEDHTRTVWLTPDILPDEKRDGEKIILLLDEITSCSKRVQVAAYQLILDRRIGQYTLPEGTFVIALGNREDDEGVYFELASPLADRFEIHFIEADFTEWLEDFAVPHGIHPLVLEFLSYRPSALSASGAEAEGLVFATPRSWERVSDILKSDDTLSDRTVRNKILGNIGEKEGNAFLDYCARLQKPVSPLDFIRKDLIPPADPDQLSDLLEGMLGLTDGIREASDAASLTAEQRDTLEKVIQALFRLPRAEYTLTGLKGLTDRNRSVVKEVFSELNDERITEFIRANACAFGTEGEDETGLLRGTAKEKWLKTWGADDR